jgi:hypothetical protein
VTLPLAQARTNGCFTHHADGTYTTTNAMALNGLPFPAPPSGHPITITPASTAHPGGQISASTLTIGLDGFNAYRGSVAWNLPADNASHYATVTTLAVPAGQTVKGLPVQGSISLAFGRDSTGTDYAALPINVELPAAFKSGPSSAAASVTGDASLRVDRNGVRYDGLRVLVDNAWVGDLQVKQVCLSFVPAGASGAVSPCAAPSYGGQPFIQCGSNPNANRWDGNAEIVLPTASKATLALFGGLSNGSLANLGGFAQNLGTSVPIADGVFLTSVGVGLCLQPPLLQLKGVVALNALPTGGTSAVTVDGSFDFIDTNPWSLTLAGDVTGEGVDLGGGSLTIYPTGLLSFGLYHNFTLLKFINVNGTLTGWLQPHRRGSRSTGTSTPASAACAPTPKRCFSTVGVAGCLDLGSFTYYTPEKNSNWHWYAPWRVHWQAHTVDLETGFGYRWHASSASLFAASCDMGPYQASPASVAQADTFSVPEGAQAVALRIAGTGGAPVVSLTSPDGTTVSPPVGATSAMLPGGGAYIENPDDSSTSVLRIKPAAGTWHVTAAAGSPPVSTIQMALTRPPAVALGAVKPIGHGRYGLHYAYALPAGESMRLFVRGPHNIEQGLGPAVGRACRQNGTAPGRAEGRRCGSVAFRPIDGPAGRRTVIGLVTEQGMPQSTVDIASFSMKRAVLPRGPRIRLARSRGGLRISWSRSGTSSYAVSVVLADGRHLSLTLSRRTASVSAVGKADSATVEIWALGSGGVAGRPGTAKLRRR